jgi:Lysozyme like domain
VTAWPPHAIAGFAARAGVATSQLPIVTALALAASGGKDHFHWHDPMVLGSDRWGLWALTEEQAGAITRTALFDPNVNARALVAHEHRYGPGFEWHESYGPEGHLAYLDFVTMALRGARPGAPVGASGTFAGRLANMALRAKAMAANARGQ